MLNKGYGSHITSMFQPGMFASNKQGVSTPTNMPKSNNLQQQFNLLSGKFPTNPLASAINGAAGNSQNTWNWQGGESVPNVPTEGRMTPSGEFLKYLQYILSGGQQVFQNIPRQYPS